jgi:hypothetical protein
MRNLEARCVLELGSAESLQTCVVLRHGEGNQEYDERIVHAPFRVSEFK